MAGGSGFLGTSLAAYFVARGNAVTILARRSPELLPPHTDYAQWDGRTLGAWADRLASADAVVNLAGRTVDCIKSPDNRDEILRSRVEATTALGRAMQGLPASSRPRVWVQMSTAHAYGDPPTLVCDEDSPFGTGLAPEVARAWEGAFAQALPSDVRAVVLRTSFVIGRRNRGGAGAMGKLGLLARLGLGGTVGSGTQGMSWIHELDMNRLFEAAITDDTMAGAYIATAPNPVSNREFMHRLRRAVGMPIGLPAPAFAVRIAAPLLLRTDPELALYGRYVVSRRLRERGFDFRFPTLPEALADLYGKGRAA
ncbi:MAG: epimerase [Phycisphaerales bacterium]